MANTKGADDVSAVTYSAKSLGMNNKMPSVEKEYEMVDQCMINDGMSAQKLAKTLGGSLDADFPVK
jgi:hypothetical protein